MSEELKPCPFCGCRAEINFYYDCYYSVQCVVCGCGTLNHRSKEKAIYDWERRIGYEKNRNNNKSNV